MLMNMLGYNSISFFVLILCGTKIVIFFLCKDLDVDFFTSCAGLA